MREVFKTILSVDEIKAKREQLGAKLFEIQLLGSDVGKSEQLINKFSECITYMDDIVSVHTPLTKDFAILPGGYCDLRYIEDGITYNAICNSAMLAHMCALNVGHDVGVVIHSSLSYRDFILCKSLREKVVDAMKGIIKTYPDIELWIENVTPIGVEGDNVYFYNGVYDDCCLIVDFINKSLPNKKLYTVFDVCHMLTTNRIVSQYNSTPSMQQRMLQFSKTCKLVHFSNVREMGFKSKQHGCGFNNSESDRALLKELMDGITKYLPTAYLCYEIAEDDYMYNANVLETRQLVQEYFNGVN